MDKVRVYYDAFAKTLTVWLANPENEEVCEEADDDTVFMKDADGHIIGFEKLNVDLAPGIAGLTVEVVNVPTSAA
jgi:uncharacterized protein YuzE